MRGLLYHPECGRVVFYPREGEYECSECRVRGPNPIRKELIESGYLKMKEVPITAVFFDKIIEEAKARAYDQRRRYD